MLRTPRRGRGARVPVPPLTALAILVNEALAREDTQPAFALATPPGSAAWTSIDVGAAASPDARARAHGRLRPSSVSGTARGSSPAPETDAEHRSVWELVTRAQGGDGDAFGLLYDRYVDQVFRFIYFRVNDRALAEDFTSETFLRALRRIGSISYQGRDIGAWFITIARNIVFDHTKSARHRLEVTTADTVETGEYAPGTEASVLTALDRERLMGAVRQLGDEQRECIVLRFLQGLSVSETAAVLGKNDGAVKALQHRAVRKLAELLGDER